MKNQESEEKQTSIELKYPECKLSLMSNDAGLQDHNDVDDLLRNGISSCMAPP